MQKFNKNTVFNCYFNVVLQGRRAIYGDDPCEKEHLMNCISNFSKTLMNGAESLANGTDAKKNQ